MSKLNQSKYIYLQTKYTHLQTKLKEARLAAGMTQTQAGKKIRQSQVFISKIENGNRNVDAIELQELANVYGVTIDYFFK